MKKHIHHIHIIILAGLVILVLIFVGINKYLDKINFSKSITFGVSFSSRYAKELGLDPKKVYSSILNDLRVKNIRLPAYWDEIEPQENQFYFDDLDYYINKASKNQTSVILAIGYKLPRWPECRAPRWIDPARLRQRQLVMLEAVIKHYENNPTIYAFQLGNEPLLEFGICPPIDREFLIKEVELVKSRTKKPVILTDSGELRFWKTPMDLSDIFGTTLYRVVDTPWIGPFQYPLRPWFYRVKSDLVRKIFAPGNLKTIISELQAESWANQPLTQTPIDEQIARFSLNQFKETINFARKTGFHSAYLWGAEWWYFMAAHGHPEYLEYAKALF